MKITLPLWAFLTLSVLFGALGVFAFAPFYAWYLAYIAIFALIAIAKNPQRRRALWGSFAWGMGFFCFGVSWLHVSIHQFGGAPLWLSYALVGVLSAYLSLYPLAFAWIVQRFRVQSPVIFPIIWFGLEMLRGWLFSGFPWLALGYSQVPSPVSGIAPLFGVEGLSVFVVLISALAYNIYQFAREKKWSLVVFQGLFLCVMATLAVQSQKLHFTKDEPLGRLKITLLQGNIPQQLKWDPAFAMQSVQTYEQLIENAFKTHSDLIILPESAMPVEEHALAPFLQAMQAKALKAKTEIMLGTVWRKDNQFYNSIINLGDPSHLYGEKTERYNKHHLVPFGEYVPLERWIRPLGSVFNLPMSAFKQGDYLQKNLWAADRRFSPAICYEIIFGEQLRKNTRGNTDYLLTISNDAWFGHSIGPWQHLQMAQMRALELGKPLIRATQNGITAFINANGDVVKQAPQFVKTSLTDWVTPREGYTAYGTFGYTPLYILSAILLFLHATMALLRKVFLRNIARKN